MSTLISDLDGTPGQGGGDEDFVQSILREMNGGDAGGGGPAPPMPSQQNNAQFIQPPPAVGAFPQGQVIQAPNPNTVAPHVMDNAPITSHMIGNSHPTAADFAAMMNTSNKGEGWAGSPAVAYGPSDLGAAPSAPRYGSRAGKKGFLSKLLDEFKTAFLVAILVFTFSLPVVNFLFAHYLPRLVKATGELTPIGLFVKSLIAGGAFWLLQRVVVPLLSL